MQQTQGSSHIHIAATSLLLMCLCNVVNTLGSKPRNQLSSRDDLVYMEVSSNCCADICVPPDLGQCSLGISGVSERKSNILACLMGNAGWLWRQCSRIGPHLELLWGTQNCFMLLR